MTYEFDFGFLAEYTPVILQGVFLTIKMAALSLLLGFVLGILFAIIRHQGSAFGSNFIRWFVDLNRNTPLIIQTFWLFFGLSAMGILLDPFYAAVVALGVNTAAYTCEIVRAGLESIPKGQIEAAECLSLNKFQVLRYVVLPQAIQKMYPALVSQFVLMMLATAIMSQISAEELTGIAYGIQSETFRGFEVYVVIAVIYLLLALSLRLTMLFLYEFFFPKYRVIFRFFK